MGNLITPHTQLASHPASNIRAELLKELDATEIERLEFRWKNALEDVHGIWPDPTVSEDKRNEWLSRVTKVLYKFFLRCGIQQQKSRSTRIDDVRRVCVARQKFTLDDVLEYAKIELQLDKEGKNRTLKDVLENDMPKTKPAPAKATDDTDAKVTILLTRLSAVEKKYHRDNEDNSILRDMLCDGYPKVKDWFDLVRLPNYNVDESAQRYDIIVGNHTTPPERMTLDEIDKSIEAMPPTVANDLPLGPQEPPNDPRIFNRKQPDGTYRPLAEYFDAGTKRDLAASVSPDEPVVTMANATDPRTYAKMDRATVTNDLPKSDKASDWFPRDKPAEEPKAEPEHWSKSDAKRGAFWAGVRGWMNKYEDMRTMEAQKRIDYTHAALGCDHLDLTPLSLDEAIAKVKAKIEDDHKSTNHTPPSHDEPVANPVEPTTPGVYSPEPKSTLRPVEAPPLNEGKNHHMEAPVIAYTTIIINDHRVNVTAREGATAEQVHDTVIALINGLRLIAADDTIKSYAAVIDNRDKTIRMKGEVKTAEPAPATPPATNGNGNGHATDGGTVGCAMIEVGTARKTGNPQLNFACDGMNFPIHYSLPVGDMVNLLSKVKQANGQPFTAADLTPNRKFGGAWRVVWEPSKSDPKYKNVVEVLPA